jgi:trk system potassium uptake protein TrkH
VSEGPPEAHLRRGLRPSRIFAVGQAVGPRSPRQAHPSYLLLGFAGLILVGTLLLLLPFSTRAEGSTDVVTALFTSSSAVCVTGMVVVDTKDYWTPFGQVVIIVLVQLGGLGFMAYATLLLILVGRKLSLRERLLASESLGRYGVRGVGPLIRRMVIATAAIELAGALALLVAYGFEDGFEAYDIWLAGFTSVSALNNAGFDLSGGLEGLTGLRDNYLLVGAAAVLVALGSLGYSVWADVAGVRRWQRFSLDTKLILALTIPLWLLGAAVFFALEHGGGVLQGNAGQEAFDSTALSVFMRSGGFSSVDLAQTDEASLFFVSGMMFIGGAPASTSGGIRLVTLAVLILAVVASVRGRQRVVAWGREIPAEQEQKALTVAVLAAATVFAIVFILASLEDAPFVELVFETVSAFGTVGLSTGLVTRLGDFSLVLLSLAMFLGRLGPLTVALALTARSQPELIHYPQENVSIG